MQGHRFRRLWTNGRTESRLAVMRSDQVEQMQAHIFRGGGQLFPFVPVIHQQLAPDRVDQLEADRDMTHQLAPLVIAHGETVLR